MLIVSLNNSSCFILIWLHGIHNDNWPLFLSICRLFWLIPIKRLFLIVLHTCLKQQKKKKQQPKIIIEFFSIRRGFIRKCFFIFIKEMIASKVVLLLFV